MAGMKINESSCWVVAGWVHDFTVKLLIKHLPPHAPQELKDILVYDQKTGLGWLSLRNLEPKALVVFGDTLEKIALLLTSGNEPFATPEILPHYLERLRELADMVAHDDRQSHGRLDDGIRMD